RWARAPPGRGGAHAATSTAPVAAPGPPPRATARGRERRPGGSSRAGPAPRRSAAHDGYGRSSRTDALIHAFSIAPHRTRSSRVRDRSRIVATPAAAPPLPPDDRDPVPRALCAPGADDRPREHRPRRVPPGPP